MFNETRVLWQQAERVGTLTLNRARAGNAIDQTMAEALLRTVDQAAEAVAQRQVGAIVVRAEGQHFCLGGDIQAFAEHRDALPALVDDILRWLNPAVQRLAGLPVPVISVVQGALGGAGIALALCADFVLAAEGIKLRGGYTAIGLSPDAGASYFVTRRAGLAQAKRLFMRNQSLSAQECLQLGLFDELHAPQKLLPAAQALAKELASGAAGSLAAVKQLCDSAQHNDLHRQLQLELSHLLARAGSADSREGIQAFLDKRAPVFSSTPNT